MGTWQELKCEFTAPDNATSGLIALEKRTTEAVTATLHIDDVELAPIKKVLNDHKQTNSGQADGTRIAITNPTGISLRDALTTGGRSSSTE